MFLKNIDNTNSKLSFFNSSAFPWIVALLAFIFWLFNLSYFGIFFMLLLLSIMFIMCQDITPSVSVFILMFFSLNTADLTVSGIIYLVIGAALFVFGITVRIVKFRLSFKFLSFKKIKHVTFSAILILPAVALSGITQAGRDYFIAFCIFAFFFAISFLYIFLFASCEGNSKLLDQTILTLTVMGALISLMMFTIALKLTNVQNIIYAIEHREFSFPWGHANNVAILLSASVPATLYYSLKLKKAPALPIVLVAFQCAAMALTGSRGALLLTAVALPVFAVYVFVKTKKRLQVGLAFAIILLAAAAVFLVFYDDLLKMFSRLFELGVSDNGRFDLYRQAIELFKSSPIFGVGFDYAFGTFGKFQIFWFHSTIFQIIACCGILGILCFGYFIFARYYVFFKSINLKKLTILSSILLFDLYGLIDIVFFNTHTFLLALLFCLAAEKSLGENEGLVFSRNKRKIKEN